jgi:hypothetical protein
MRSRSWRDVISAQSGAWDGSNKRQLLADGMRLRSDYFGRTESLPSLQLELDSGLYREVRQLYIEHNCRTWDSLYNRHR